jgi:hypothetical protein
MYYYFIIFDTIVIVNAFEWQQMIANGDIYQ